MRQITWNESEVKRMTTVNECAKVSSPWLPTAIKRILLWGIPSLTFLGLVGIAGWRIFRSSKSKNVEPVKPAVSEQKHNGGELLTSDSTKHSANSSDSGVVTEEATEEAANSLQNEAEADGDKKTAIYPPAFNRGIYSPYGKKMTSSNVFVHPPPQEAESPESPNTKEVLQPIPPIDLHSSSTTTSSTDLGNSSSSSTSTELVPFIRGDDGMFRQLGEDVILVGKPKNTPLVKKEEKDRMRVMFQLPREIVGRFIGKQGRNIKALMMDSGGSHVYINQKYLPKTAEMVPCTVQGTQQQVEQAIKIIKMRYPEVDVPDPSENSSPLLQRASPIPSPLFGMPGLDGEVWDVELLKAVIPSSSFSAMICYIENLTSVWMVSCEKSIELDDQHQSMSYTYCYSATTGSNCIQPKEEDKSLLGKFCAVRVSEIHWLRGRITKFGDDLATYEVQLMDYGSTVIVPPSAIKPLRKEHGRLPIQAFNCTIAHVKPEDLTSEAGMISLQQMVEGVILEVHIITASLLPPVSPPDKGKGGSPSSPPLDQGSKVNPMDTSPEITAPNKQDSPQTPSPLAPYVPLVELYTQTGSTTPVFINRELVELGYGIWTEATQDSVS